MTRARKTLVDPETTSYYHCIRRCVRRAWLWGEDRISGRNYEHRKNWVVTRLAELAEVFTLDVCAYAVMSNHYHLVVRLDVEKARALSEDEVIARYSRLFKVPLLAERYLDGLTSEAENLVAQKILGQWRERLCDLSWYMRGLNEYLARRANAEDGCKGRFWTVERIRRLQPQSVSGPQASQDDHVHVLGYTERDYLELVDWAGRAICADKRGAIPSLFRPF